MSALSIQSLTRKQKAAALIMGLGFERAQPMLDHLSPDDQEALALEVARLGEVRGDELEGVVGEFLEEARARGYIIYGSLDSARELLRRTRGPEADEVIARLVATVRVTPFRFLYDREPGALAQHMSEEHPQTVALVLSRLPASTAARILAGFAPELQREVAQRVATMEPTSPDVVLRVEEALKARLGDSSTPYRRSEEDGIRELASILNSSDRGVERTILTALESEDPRLAEQVRDLMFVFEDVVKLDDRSMQRVLREVEQESLIYALKGVRSEVADKVVRNVSERAAAVITDELEMLGPVRVSAVEEAQGEIVRTIRRLEESGDIVVLRDGTGGDLIE